MVAVPVWALGCIFLVSAVWALLTLPSEYRQQRRLPRWTLPLPRMWAPERDVLMSRIVAAIFALGGVYLIVTDLF